MRSSDIDKKKAPASAEHVDGRLRLDVPLAALETDRLVLGEIGHFCFSHRPTKFSVILLISGRIGAMTGVMVSIRPRVVDGRRMKLKASVLKRRHTITRPTET